MTDKSTPGPWIWTVAGENMRTGYSQGFAIGERGRTNLIAGCFSDVAGGEEVAQANACLMSSSPDMRAALEMVLRRYTLHPDDAAACRAALTKAAGKV